MKKVVVLLVLTGLLVAFAAPSAFAALTDQQQKELDSIYQQMNDLQKQLVELYREADLITKEQATNMLDGIDARSQYQDQNGYGWGAGAGWGGGMMGGFGFGGPGGYGCPGWGYGR